MTVNLDRLLTLNMLGHETSEDDLIFILEHAKKPEQDGARQLRLVAVWIDVDKDARLNRFEHLLQYVNLDTISYEMYAAISDWKHAIGNCEQSR